ncbi:hypothetical protein [Acinetobacter sp. F-1]|uniref:hypothetical protein n=1 Tax=Acinetobacter sp. F-1 TaxID=1796981 RepID=UPI001FD50998|nr:hypothetical protein [Acinetobacter sp. F-1]
MAKLKKEQNVALDIIDFIHFFDVYNLVSLSDDKNEFYDLLLDLIDTEIKSHRINIDSYQILKHYLICGIEIVLNKFEHPDPDSYENCSISKETADKVHEHDIHFSLALLSILAEQKGIDKNILIESVSNIVSNKIFKKYPLHLYYRLANQLLCHEYIGASFYIYKKFLDLEILTSSKYPESKITSEDHNKSNDIFTRVCLLIEFELYRRSSRKKIIKEDKITLHIPQKFATNVHKDNLIRYYKKLIDNVFNQDNSLKVIMFFPSKCIDSRENLERFLTDIYDDFIHNRMFVKNHIGWISTLGALHIQMYKEAQEDISIYSTLNNEDNASDLVSRIFKNYGFWISSKNLYIHYKKLRKIHYKQVEEYHRNIMNFPTLLGWDNTDHLYNFSLKLIPS